MTRLLEDVTADPLRTHVIGFKFFWDYFSPAYTVGGVMGYLYRLNSQVGLSFSPGSGGSDTYGRWYVCY